MTAPMVSVYDGQTCIGWVLRRHWVNGWAVAYEALDPQERSLGIFSSDHEAAEAVWRSARGQIRSVP
jgi:hypothetical protein